MFTTKIDQFLTTTTTFPSKSISFKEMLIKFHQKQFLICFQLKSISFDQFLRNINQISSKTIVDKLTTKIDQLFLWTYSLFKPHGFQFTNRHFRPCHFKHQFLESCHVKFAVNFVISPIDFFFLKTDFSSCFENYSFGLDNFTI